MALAKRNGGSHHPDRVLSEAGIFTPEQFAQVEQLLEQMAFSHSVELESQFCFGFAAGIRLQQEVDRLLKKK